MKHFAIEEVNTWQRHYRTNFINCLSGFKSAMLIGTVSNNRQTNAAVFSNIVHIGANPAPVGFMNRPRQAAPHTIANIESTGVYTMNHIHTSFVQQAHQTSAKYAEDENEFEKVGLIAEWKANIAAPFVAESKIKYAVQLVEIIPVKHNETFLVIGRVTNIFIDETIIDKDGYLHIDTVGSVVALGIDGYYETHLSARYSYAKPGIPTEKIN
jgi:flavin reductase (DIM6/NTAB) family NADH-FMN oxidoreductase RutF